MKAWFLAFILILIGLWLSTSFVAVDEGEFAVILRFGEVVRPILEPGLHLKLPWPVDSNVRIDSRLRTFLGKPDELITQDGHNVMVASYVVWEVKDPVEFYATLPGLIPAFEVRLGSHITGLIGAFVSEINLNQMVNTDPAAPRIEALTQTLAGLLRDRVEEEYGVRIRDFRLRRLNYPDQNRADIFDRMRAERQILINQYTTEGDRIAREIRSAAERDAQILRARAKRDADVIRGKGEAEASHIYNAASELDPEFYRLVQELETMRRIYDGQDTLVVPSDWNISHRFFKPSDGAAEAQYDPLEPFPGEEGIPNP